MDKENMTTTMPDSGLLCSRHPDRETSLRCNRCEQPMCIKCAVLTPTGYRCVDCVKSLQKVFDNVQPQDYVFAIGLAVLLTFLGSRLVAWVGFFTILVVPFIGTVIAEIIRAVIQRRRGRRLFQLVAVGAAAGAILPILFALLTYGFYFGLIWQGLYAFLAENFQQ